jgi:predicted component of type VI protein secretion system
MIFKVLIIAIVYLIIFYALRLIYKDMKNGEKKKVAKKSFAIEVVEAGENTSLKKGGIIIVHRELTFGRKEDNTVILSDPYVSSHHGKISLKNTDHILQDLGSTNGIEYNGQRLVDKAILNSGDTIRIGGARFKVI